MSVSVNIYNVARLNFPCLLAQGGERGVSDTTDGPVQAGC